MSLKSLLRHTLTMANVALNNLSASNIFDLRGVIAVVTGGGTVREFCINVVPEIITLRRVLVL